MVMEKLIGKEMDGKGDLWKMNCYQKNIFNLDRTPATLKRDHHFCCPAVAFVPNMSNK